MKIPLELLRPSQLMVQLPISAYTSATVLDLGVLRPRLEKSKLVPLGWTVAEKGSQPAFSRSIPTCGAVQAADPSGTHRLLCNLYVVR